MQPMLAKTTEKAKRIAKKAPLKQLLVNLRLELLPLSTLKYLINEHKKLDLIKEHCGILTRKNKRTYKKT